ncbi:hypothetical protein NE237_012829 [Protea cynaroides]|uniref:Uncharacterized protein n=1 Tax=Protea cynaroides TaxID=273540 RepID=A0A9Q0GXI2_9MAGN|nr:hypothetical protein NE237_012829 [Protea cynaroides]
MFVGSPKSAESKRLKLRIENSERQNHEPLKAVVSDCVKQWFLNQDVLSSTNLNNGRGSYVGTRVADGGRVLADARVMPGVVGAGRRSDLGFQQVKQAAKNPKVSFVAAQNVDDTGGLDVAGAGSLPFGGPESGA